MSLVAAWLVFPAILLALAIGCGLLVERVVVTRLPGALIPVTGLALIVVLGQYLTLADATAELITPVTVSLAIAGIGLGWRGAWARLDRWVAAVGLVSFAAFAAPVVLSGEATFAGYVKLDDTATWMALIDRVMEHGRSLDGLAPSTYEATLAFNLGDGYPVGVFLPLGVATLLSAQDVAWTIQPYMATLGALLALALWQLATPLLASRPLRAVVAAVGSQSALLYGYYLWGGIKEIAAAALLASVVPLASLAIARRGEPRSLLPLALICAAEIGVLSAGGVIWLAAPLAGAVVLLVAAAGGRAAWRSGAWGAGMLTVLSLPVLLTGGLLPPTSSQLTSGDARGNLIEPVEPAQVAGIWPAGDFRLEPTELGLSYVLIAVAIGAAIGALVLCWRRRAWTVPLYVGGTLLACLVIYAFGSPWVDGKALATASPAILFAAALGGALLCLRGRRVVGGLLLVAIAGGVLWSNALQYRDVNLAPREQLAELEEIGALLDGEGPTLIAEYQPYGARHFLRQADPEAASELRRRVVPLVDGGSLAKGAHADTDRLRLDGLYVYRSLVVRRGPAQSRPPSPYRLSWEGDYYEVWQRLEADPRRVVSHLGLGDGVSPVGEPSCAEVRDLARQAEGGTLVAAARPGASVTELGQADYPPAWAPAGDPDHPAPAGAGEISATVSVERAGEYGVWLKGSIRPRADLWIDGARAGSVRHQINNEGLFTHLGEARLKSGPHEIEIRFGGADLQPGSGGRGRPIGPLVLSDSSASDARLRQVAPERAEELCGRSWDWIEAVGAS